MFGLVMFLLFTLIPALETWLIIKVGGVIGALDTVALLVLAGVLGAWLGKRAGTAVLGELFQSLQQGIPPGDKVVEGLLVLVASVLLVTPGYFTDLVGLLLFIGPIRGRLAPLVKKAALRWLMPKAQGGGIWFGNLGPGPAMREKGFYQHPPEGGQEAASHRFKHPEA
jgi:UPF0716 protein FxsA